MGKNFFRRNNVAQRFTHLSTVFDYHALSQQVAERFIIINQACVTQNLYKEAGIQQMQNSMLNTADILVYRTPIVIEFLVKRHLVVVCVGITQIIPGGAQEGVHGIGFTGCVSTAFRAFAVNEFFGGCQRRFSTGSKAYVLRQTNRQLVFRNQNLATMRAIDDRNRSAPITLTADQPIAQTIVYTAFTEAFSFSLVHDSAHSLVHFHAGEFAGVNQHAFFFFVSAGHFFQLQLFADWADSNDFFNAVFVSKHPVTLVTGRNAHNGAGTVIIQYIVGYPDFYLAAGERVNAVYAGEYALFFGFAGSTFNFGLITNTLAESVDFVSLRIVFANLFNQRMLGSQSHEGYAVSSIRTGGVNSNSIVQCRNFKGEFQAFAAADPVVLHGFYALGPARQQVKILQQLISIIGDFEEPLAQILFNNLMVAAPAFAVDNLLVSQYGVTGVAPVYGRFLFNCQTAFVEQLKEPLSPFVIIFLAGGNLAIPIVGQTESLQLTSHVSDVFQSPFFRRNIVFDSSVFSRHTKGVPAHRMQNVEALHSAETCDYVADGIVTNMAHVQVAGRIGEHFQNVGFRLILIHLYFKGFVFFPVFLPFSFNIMGSILFLNHFITSQVLLLVENKKSPTLKKVRDEKFAVPP